MKLFVFALLFAVVSAKIYFQEDFSGNWEDRWVHSSAGDAETNANFIASAGDYYNDKEKDTGIQTSIDARFYKVSAEFPAFSNKDKDLVLQYTVKNTQDLDCGGGYIKLLPPGLDQANFEGGSPYNIMFGPDQCGSSNKKVHLILSYKGENYLIEEAISPASDRLTHLYTAIIHPDQTYEVRIDNEVVASGTIEESWSIFPPKQINDPEASKPEDWVDEPQIPDPEAVKPEDWDDVPAEIPDPDAEKPEDWDDELDGEWEAPLIDNPDYQGEWEAPYIPNPDYKGEWEHPQIDNPDYFYDPEVYAYEHAFVGFEIWQVKTGTIFDNILVTDSVEEAEAFAEGYFQELVEGEKEMFDTVEAEREAAEEAEREAERKRLEEEAEAEEEEDDDEEEREDDEGEAPQKDEL